MFLSGEFFLMQMNNKKAPIGDRGFRNSFFDWDKTQATTEPCT